MRGVYYKGKDGKNFSVEPTKRYVYGVLVNRIKKWQKADSVDKEQFRVVALAGVRRIGKTTVMKQIYNKLNDIVYIDSSLYADDLHDLLWDKLDSNVRYIFIDEVCKLNNDNLMALVNYINNMAKDKFIILTGSVSKRVEDIADMTGICSVIKLQPIMYAERLAWEYGVSFKETLKYTANEKFINWVKFGHTTYISNLRYIRGIVKDTLRSYNTWDCWGTYDDVLKIYPNGIPSEHIRIIWKYVVYCQFLYIKMSDNTFADVGLIELANNKDTSVIVKRLNALKSKISTKILSSFCKMLEGSGLATPVYLYNEEDNDRIKALEDKYRVKAYLFEYPQILQLNLGDEVTRGTLNLWVEYTLLMKASHCYFNVGKYRTKDSASEVDIVYTLGEDDFEHKYLIEVKNNAERNTNPKKYLSIGFENNEELAITEKDRIYNDIELSLFNPDRKAFNKKFKRAYRIRNDIAVLLMELGFIEKSYKYNEYQAVQPLGKLYDKYKNLL